MLRIDAANKAFGGVAALRAVTLAVAAGEVVGLIGPNGSGKSTLVNVVSGFIRLDAGSVSLDGAMLSNQGPAAVRRAGVARTFQNLRLFEAMSALDNLKAGLHLMFTHGRGMSSRWLTAAVGMPSMRGVRREVDAAAHTALEAVGLTERASTLVANLSYGEKKRLEIARALLLGPSFVLLDEPTAGLSPDEAWALIALVGKTGEGRAAPGVLLVEHRLDLVLRVCDRIVVMDNGTKIAEGPPADIAANAQVQEVYVGA